MNSLYWIYFSLLFKSNFCNCSLEKNLGATRLNASNKVEKIGKFNPQINESSGLEIIDNFLITHNDGGDQAVLYKTDFNGTLIDKINIPNAINTDWEDITSDGKGKLFIGDFGNNSFNRDNQKIYIYENEKVKIINFKLENIKSELGEDMEAMFYYNDSLYLISKSWQKKEMLAKMFVLPAKEGDFEAKYKDQIILNTSVTAADVSPDMTKFALLTYGKVIVFKIVDGKVNFSKPELCIKTRRKQTEGLVFKDDNNILISNEQKHIYSIKLK